MLHQFEEFVYPGGLPQWINRSVFQVEDGQQPLTKRIAFIVNVPVLWTLFAVMAFLGSDNLWFSLPVLSILFVNAWFHIVMSIVFNEYVPGSYTSIILHLPLTIYAYSFLLITWQTDFSMLMTSIMAALVVHIFAISFMRGRFKAIPKSEETKE